MGFVYLLLSLPICFSLNILLGQITYSLSFSASPNKNQRFYGKSSTQQQIYNAIALSKDAQSNITAAHFATSAWKRILQEDVPTTLEPHILIMCQALYASTLTRIGRDENGENNRWYLLYAYELYRIFNW